MPLPAWLVAIGTWLSKHIGLIIGILTGASFFYFTWQAGSSILAGIQQASPGIGQMVASMGMLFSLLPPIIMMMMFMWIMGTFMSLFR